MHGPEHFAEFYTDYGVAPQKRFFWHFLKGEDTCRRPATYGVEMKGHGMFLHNDPDDRPAGVFDGTTTLVSGPQHPSHLLLPVIPRAQEGSPSIRRGPYRSSRTPGRLHW